MSEGIEPTFQIGEIAIVIAPKDSSYYFEPQWIGQDVIIRSQRGYQTTGIRGSLKFRIPDGYICDCMDGTELAVAHLCLKRKRPPEALPSKLSFEELLSNLKSEQPLETPSHEDSCSSH